MRRSQRLQVVLDLELRREDAALEIMARARETWEQETERLRELQGYHQEYQDQLRAASQGRISATQLQGWQHFISRLTLALTHQQERVAESLRQFEESRGSWREIHERRRGMERYIAECRDQERRADERLEQKQSDEAAGNRFARMRRH